MDDATIPISNISAVPETRCQCGGTFVFDDARGMMVCRSCRQIKCLVTEKALAPGDLIDDRYRLLKLIGKGGMGSLYLCAPKAQAAHTLLATFPVNTQYQVHDYILA